MINLKYYVINAFQFRDATSIGLNDLENATDTLSRNGGK